MVDSRGATAVLRVALLVAAVAGAACGNAEPLDKEIVKVEPVRVDAGEIDAVAERAFYARRSNSVADAGARDLIEYSLGRGYVDAMAVTGVAARRLAFAEARLDAQARLGRLFFGEVFRVPGGTEQRAVIEIAFAAHVVDAWESIGPKEMMAAVVLQLDQAFVGELQAALRGEGGQPQDGERLGAAVASWSKAALLTRHGWRPMVDEEGHRVLVAFGQAARASDGGNAFAQARGDARALAATEMRDLVEWLQQATTRRQMADWSGSVFDRVTDPALEPDAPEAQGVELAATFSTAGPFARRELRERSMARAGEPSLEMMAATTLEQWSIVHRDADSTFGVEGEYRRDEAAWADARLFSERMSPVRVLREWQAVDGGTGDHVVGVVLAIRLRDLAGAVRRGNGGR